MHFGFIVFLFRSKKDKFTLMIIFTTEHDSVIMLKVKYIASFSSVQPLQDIPSTTTHEKDRKVYDRLFLLQCSDSPHANDMPLELKKIKGDEEDVFNSFINPMVSLVTFDLCGSPSLLTDRVK